MFILTCIGGRRPGDSEYSPQTLTHGPLQEAGAGSTAVVERPSLLGGGRGRGGAGRAGRAGRQSCRRQAGVLKAIRGLASTVRAHERPRCTVSVDHKQKESRREGEREGGGPRVRERERDGQKEREKCDCMCVCVWVTAADSTE